MITEGINLVGKIAELGVNLSDADQQVLRNMVKDHKRMNEACNIAEQIFFGKTDTKVFGDNSFTGTDLLINSNPNIPETEKDEYRKLRSAFNKND